MAIKEARAFTKEMANVAPKIKKPKIILPPRRDIYAQYMAKGILMAMLIAKIFLFPEFPVRLKMMLFKLSSPSCLKNVVTVSIH